MPAVPRTFGSTIAYDLVPAWGERARMIDAEIARGFHPWLEARRVVRVVRGARRHDVLVVTSHSGRLQPDLIGTALVRLLPARRRPTIVLMGCMWSRDPGLRGRLQALAVRLADPAVTRYAVQSTAEVTGFARAWGLRPGKAGLALYCSTLAPGELAAPVTDKGFVFAGGDALRDYPRLVEAARRLPDERFVFATAALDGRADLPPNVTARRVPHTRFVELLHTASVVAVPLRQGLVRAAGQQTYLNAMMLGKPVVVHDAPGVADHIRDGVDGVIVDGSVEGWVEALRSLLGEANAARREELGRAAAAAVRSRFTIEHHVGALLAVVDEAIAERSMGRPQGTTCAADSSR